jgi:hypothetical protein
MKLAIKTKKMSSRIFNRAPINFWEPEKVEEDPTTKASHEDSIYHEVKYNPTDKESESYKLYILNHSLTVLLSNGSNSWITSTSSFVAMNSTTTVWSGVLQLG